MDPDQADPSPVDPVPSPEDPDPWASVVGSQEVRVVQVAGPLADPSRSSRVVGPSVGPLGACPVGLLGAFQGVAHSYPGVHLTL